MTHTLVKILIDDDGLEVDDQQWHLLETGGGGPHALCTGEYVGAGESACVYKLIDVHSGIPCSGCREIVMRHKNIAL